MMEEIGRTGTPSPRFSNMLPTKPSDTGKSKSAADKPTGPEFRYLSHILWGLLPPLLIMLAYGGRPTLIALCFGCIFTYIFDLLGTMEVNLFLLFDELPYRLLFSPSRSPVWRSGAHLFSPPAICFRNPYSTPQC